MAQKIVSERCPNCQWYTIVYFSVKDHIYSSKKWLPRENVRSVAVTAWPRPAWLVLSDAKGSLPFVRIMWALLHVPMAQVWWNHLCKAWGGNSPNKKSVGNHYPGKISFLKQRILGYLWTWGKPLQRKIRVVVMDGSAGFQPSHMTTEIPNPERETHLGGYQIDTLVESESRIITSYQNPFESLTQNYIHHLTSTTCYNLMACGRGRNSVDSYNCCWECANLEWDSTPPLPTKSAYFGHQKSSAIWPMQKLFF